MELKVSVGLPGKHKTYTSSNDFKRFNTGKASNYSVASVITEAVVAEAYQRLNLTVGQKLTPDDKKALKIEKKAIRREINRDDYIKKTSIENSGLFLKAKYEVAAQTFYRIVCRTPYDEDYKYTVSITEKEYKPGKIFKSTGKSWKYVNHTFVRTHIADEDRVKDYWQMRFRTKEGFVNFTMDDFKNISFENISDGNWRQVFNIIGLKAKWMDFNNLQIFNLHPRVDLLEYGRYTKDFTYSQIERHQGPNREHGIFKGYSVQAPRGFLGISLLEMEKMVTVNKYKEVETKSYTDKLADPKGMDDGYMWRYTEKGKERRYSDATEMHLGFYYDLSKDLKRIVNQQISISPNGTARRIVEWFEEKDLLKAVQERKRTIEFSTPEIRERQRKIVNIANAELKKNIDIITNRNFNTYESMKKNNKKKNEILDVDIKTPKTEMKEDCQFNLRDEKIKNLAHGEKVIYGVVNLKDESGKEQEYYARIKDGKMYKTLSPAKFIEQENIRISQYEPIDIVKMTEDEFNELIGPDGFLEIQG